VDEQYDHGDIIFQATCEVSADDTPTSLAAKINALEHRYFPAVIEKILKEKTE
jgi:phosphoribosylglycinamide formyltransferase-1